MSFAQHDHVIEALSTYRANHPLAIWVLPGRSRRGWDFFNTHAFDATDEVVAVDAVAIADEKTWCFLVREGVDDLLGSPLAWGFAITLK